MAKVPTNREIETYSGHFLDVSNPDPERITLRDIAHALSNVCRYGGHSKVFYSVAEHAVFVSKRLERRGYSAEVQFGGLHHDDSESYLGDIPHPIKPMLGEPYGELTDGVDEAIEKALGLPHIDDHAHAIIKEADTWSTLVEARHLLVSQGKLWDLNNKGRPWKEGQPERIITPDYWHGGLSPEGAERLFLARHNEFSYLEK